MVGYGAQQCHQEPGIRSFCSAILKVLSIWPLPASCQLQKYMHPKVGQKEWELLTHLRGEKTCPRNLQHTFTEVALARI